MSSQLESDIHEIKQTLATESVKTNLILSQLQTTQQMHGRELYGDGDKRAGLKTDVDRLKQTEKSRAKITGAIGTGVVGLALNAIWNAMRGH